MTKEEYVVKAVRLISEGHHWQVETDDVGNLYITVKNPSYREDLGNDMYYVLTVPENEIRN